MVKKALCVVLSERNRNENVKVVSIVNSKELKDIRSKVLKDIEKKTLIISDNDRVKMALRNVKGVNVLTPMRVNVKKCCKQQRKSNRKDAVKILEERLLNGK